jgi:hypothetical protein
MCARRCRKYNYRLCIERGDQKLQKCAATNARAFGRSGEAQRRRIARNQRVRGGVGQGRACARGEGAEAVADVIGGFRLRSGVPRINVGRCLLASDDNDPPQCRHRPRRPPHVRLCRLISLVARPHTRAMSEIRRKLVIVGDGACGKVRSPAVRRTYTR